VIMRIAPARREGREEQAADMDVAAPGSVPVPALRRTLRPWQVSVAGIGVILGAGVYASPA
jgi:hypothetical protein